MIEYTVKVSDTGTKFWYLDGKLHREDGPAVEWVDGTKEWCKYGKWHRVDGPAFEWADGTKEWYLDDEKLTETEFNQLNQVVTIAGVQYKLTQV